MVKKLQATNVQDQTWILSEAGARLGILSEQPDHTYQFLGKGGTQTFQDLHMLEQHLGGKIHWVPKSEPTDAAKTTQVNHLPIKHDSAVDVQETPYVSYKKVITSDTRFAAGYWILKFSTGWSGSLSPKCDTLAEYEHQGPFQSKLEMNTILAQRNSEFKREQEKLK
jgi:hypothetical protein